MKGRGGSEVNRNEVIRKGIWTRSDSYGCVWIGMWRDGREGVGEGCGESAGEGGGEKTRVRVWEQGREADGEGEREREIRRSRHH